MEECEVCGKPSPTLFVVSIEGAHMQACSSCARGKEAISAVSGKPVRAAQARSIMKGDEEELVDNYAAVIKRARENMGLKIEELGLKINERKSHLAKIEEGRAIPEDKLMKKLEKELGIKLRRKAEAGGATRSSYSPAGLTLGDALIKKEPKKKQ